MTGAEQTQSEYRMLIGDEWIATNQTVDVLNKYTNTPFAKVHTANRETVDKAIRTARQSFDTGFIEPFDRYEILMSMAGQVRKRFTSIVETMILETGFTRADCRNDLSRSIQTLVTSAEEAKRVVGEIVPIHAAPGQNSDRIAYTVRDPIGVVCAITPFNSPFNTVCHKIAPAIAAGNSVVLKPALHTPACATLLCEMFVEAGLPEGWLNLLHGEGSKVGTWLVESSDIDYFTFTGSTQVGRRIQSGAGLRRTQMELGNISGTIVCADANVDRAIERCVGSSFRKAGQVCTSVQRLLVERSIIQDFAESLTNEASALKTGDPWDDVTDIGPMISPREVNRANSWIDQATAAGATCLLEGQSSEVSLSPTIVLGAGPGMRVFDEEVFAPVVTLTPFDSLDEAISIVNDTPFGLAGGIFTSSLDKGIAAAKRVRVGAFHINDTSSSRVDLMPYGGVKESGFGLEGPRYAIRDMTEERLITITPSATSQ